jgi:lipopolysaccharide biosynthesis glycosyltransferase
MSEAKDLIHVVLAVYDPKGTYSRYAGVVMTSIFEHTKSPVCVHILHDRTLTDDNRRKFSRIAEKFGQEVQFVDVTEPFAKINQNGSMDKLSKHFTRGALFRLLISDLIDTEKVIYMDCDVVVNMDIRELWNIGIEDYSFAGALDRPAGNPYRRFSFNAFRLRLMKCDRKTCINSGVLYMNLSRIRKKFRLSVQGVSWYKRYAHCSSLADQDLINSYFCGDIKIIDSRFNNCHAHEGDISDSILHAICAPKPWNGSKGSALDRLYWKTYLKTPWGCLSPDEIVDILIDVTRNSPYMHRHTSQCYKKILSRLLKDFIYKDIVKIVWFFLKDLYYRMKFHTTAILSHVKFYRMPSDIR